MFGRSGSCLRRRVSPETKVAEIATPLPIAITEETEIIDAAALMLNQEVRHLTVELPTGSSGIVPLRGILAVLLQAAQPELWLSTLRVKVAINSRRRGSADQC